MTDNQKIAELLNNNSLSEAERQEVLRILNEMADTGTSPSYVKLLQEDFTEIPVDIMTFIKDRRYLGNAWYGSDGSFKMYPYWQDVLQRLFPTNIDTAVNNVIESGARGLGKSEIGITIGLYMMYRVMCLRNPHDYFHLKPTEKIAFAFMNITKYLAEDIGITKFQNTIQMSPWFMERGTITGINNKVWNPPDYIDIIVGSQSSHVIGQPIYFAMFDEIDFIKNQDIERQKQIAMDMIDTAIGGMKTRFIHKGKNPTVLVLASSKRSDKSFLEEHMKKKLADEGEEKNTLIVDEPVWNVKPADSYSGKRFAVGLGNKFLASEIIPEGADLDAWQNKGYKIIQVPIEFKSEFLDNIDRALCDFAGIAASELSKYISAMRLNTVKKPEVQNLFVKDIIEVGNAADDTNQYFDFIDTSRIDPVLITRPLYIHLDMSISGDKTGIAGTWIVGKKPSLNNDARELHYRTAFYVSIKAPKGHQVSFAKNREFIYWLKEQGFNIKGVSTDTYQNATLAQDLTSKGYNYSIISVDRVNSDRICEPYQYLKNTIYEERIQLPADSPLLTEELLGLERNGNTGKIDHPDGGRYGSKDSADAVCGSLWNASKHAEEYNFEFGETLDVMVDVSSNDFANPGAQQLTVDFEEELKRTAGAFGTSLNQENSQFIDFGFGAATSNFDYYMADGIII